LRNVRATRSRGPGERWPARIGAGDLMAANRFRHDAEPKGAGRRDAPSREDDWQYEILFGKALQVRRLPGGLTGKGWRAETFAAYRARARHSIGQGATPGVPPTPDRPMPNPRPLHALKSRKNSMTAPGRARRDDALTNFPLD